MSAIARSSPPVRAAAAAREVPAGRRPGWWGMMLAIVADLSTFASLIAAYYYLRFVTTATWPPPGDSLPKLTKASIMTGLLVISVVPLLLADRGLRRGSRGRMALGGLVTALLGAAFVVLEIFEYEDELATTWPTKDAYGSLFYVLTGFHLVHIMAAVVALLLFTVAAAIGRMGRAHHIVIRLFALFWYASVGVWVLIYLTLYWAVRL